MENKQIRINSIRKSDGDTEKSVSNALCKLRKMNDTISVFYKEKLDDNTFVNTKINAKKDEVEIIRTGEYAVRMVWKPNFRIIHHMELCLLKLKQIILSWCSWGRAYKSV